ncbi:hypothetical protein GOP47_0028159 [Adiantum capillus-veneris]|nr:hypothetical protein GOP47_0028159 [Adiantum capillus-veneris]
MGRFDIPHKGTNLEPLERWRKGVFVLNAARRFRHTLNVQKIREAQERRNFKVAVLVTQAALIFIGTRFKVAAQILEYLQGNHELYEKLGGLQGISSKLDIGDLDSGILGTDADVKERKEDFGENKYDEKPPRGFWVFVWEAFHDLTLIILVVCAVISLAVGILSEGISTGWYDGVGILASILIVVFVTAISDYRQSLQFQELEKEKKKVKVSVIRGGTRRTIFNHEVVVGDTIVLSTGDQVSADGIYVSGNSLTIDESSLTGESEPVHPSAEKPFLLSGTMVQNGEGRMLVTAVGMRTEWGKLMAKLSEGGSRETPLQVRLNGVATIVGKIGLGFAVTTFLVLMVRFVIARFNEGWDNWRSEYLLQIVNYFATSVTILVVAVPEGLPLAVTLSLAYAMKQMMKDNALVRNLSACETMGSATCICSDKTGTLTTNHMTVVKVCCFGFVEAADKVARKLSDESRGLFCEGIFLNTSGEISERDGHHEVHGSPTESAILELGMSLGGHFRNVRSRYHIVRVEPFSSATKRMLTLVKLDNGKFRSYCKGASEIVLSMCGYKIDEGKTKAPLDSEEKRKLEEVIRTFARESLRTLCLAFIDLDYAPGDDEELPTAGLTFMGIVGIKDPVRPGVKEAVQLCFKAGIKVRMVTGDNIETASAIARECNILTEDGIAIEGPSFRNWSPAEMMEKVHKIQVIARSSPLDKLKLVEYLKSENEVVAVTGDGTNDAPALHEADIGLAMGIAGTEVAKSSADVIVLDDNFTTIVNVAMWGRSVYINIQKFVQFQLTVNLVALTINFVSACVTGEAPLTAVQLLWVNLIMDTLGALALATEPPYEALMERPPVGRKGSFITNVMWRNIIGQAIYQLIVLWVLQFLGEQLLRLRGEDADSILNTMIFNSFVFLQVFNEINSRDMEKLNVFSSICTNKVFVSVLLFTVAFQVIIVEFLGNFADTSFYHGEKVEERTMSIEHFLQLTRSKSHC